MPMNTQQPLTSKTKKILLNLDANIMAIIDDVRRWRNSSRTRFLNKILSEWLVSNRARILDEAKSRDKEINDVLCPPENPISIDEVLN